MGFAGVALKSVSFFLRIIEFCCAAIILGIFSYFLAVLSNHSLGISTYVKAVEGISGAGVIYTLLALGFVCCLGGIAFFSFLGMLLDLAFTGAFIYIAYATRHGANSCSGIVNTPLGIGNTATGQKVSNGSGGSVHLPKLHTACKLNTAAFAVSIIAAVFFFLSIFLELALARHHKREKAFGPSPNNGYTAGSPKRKFWQRKPKTAARDAEFGEKPDALPAHVTPADATLRHSYGTESTAVGTEPTYMKYGAPTAAGGLNQNQSSGVVNHGGWQTTTSTHVPGQATELPASNPARAY
ncbi:hypothetical protein LHYA1_G008997 [Lachnellula hyalina]|uniref:MARVEL domain-containing protein n=1 Tax=Lachnellula hyalina TaxID=1316788 RepID=A0A8H8TUI9_9HELO|nr:uncharacterized protein LHYA1_G008997 [Lachnellula hyalina]TVY22332.1 hypothetical protein LHYA1_G008997 [Lachnellula hyalina]